MILSLDNTSMLAKVWRLSFASRGTGRPCESSPIVANRGGLSKKDGRNQDLASIFSMKEMKRV